MRYVRKLWYRMAIAFGTLTLFCSAVPLAAQLRKSDADTARMVWGRNDFSRYLSADVCSQAALETWVDLIRTDITDTAGESSSGDLQLPASVVSVAKSCGSKFTVEGTSPRELWGLARISLVVNNDAQAKAVIDRKLLLLQSPVAKAEGLLTAFRICMQAVPARLNMAQSYMQQLLAVGDSAHIEQFTAYVELMNYWHRLYQPDSIRSIANQAIALGKRMSTDEQNTVEVFRPYHELIDLANEAGDLKLQQRLLDSALMDVGPWRDGTGTNWTTPMTRLLETRVALYGKKTKPLSGTFWFNNNGVPRPAPGKMSLIVNVSHVCGTGCYGVYNTIRSLQKQYGADLDVTIVTSTVGYATGTGPLAPAEEAQKAADFYLNYLKIPAAILVEETPISKRDDGRILRGTSKFAETFASMNAVLVDRNGVIRWLGLIQSTKDKRMINAAIVRVMAEQASGGE